MEGIPPSYGFPFDDPRVRACAMHWAVQLRRQKISDTTDEDLLQDAWRLSQPSLSSGGVENEIAFARTVIGRLALMRMRRARRRREESVDPTTDSPLARHGNDERGFAEVDRWLLVQQTVAYLDRHRYEIWAAVTERLGPAERPDSTWAAARRAAMHLLIQRDGEDVDEALGAAMMACDEWWRADGQPGEPIRKVMERRRKRIARDRPWVSYIALLEALPWAWLDQPVTRRELARHHLRHVRILLGEARDNAARRAAIERHIAEIEHASGLTLSDADPTSNDRADANPNGAYPHANP